MHSLNGRRRRLERLRDPNGVISILAIDHTESLRWLLPESASADDDLVASKVEVTRELCGDVGSVLLDPLLGAGPVLDQGLLSAETGLLLSLEAVDYNELHSPPALLRGWGPQQAVRAGTDAAKLLVYFRPDAPDAADRVLFVKHAVEACHEAQLPLLVEPLLFPLDDDNEHTDLTDIYVDMASRMCETGADVLKLAFPPTEVDAGYEVCAQITEVAEKVPWVLLSQGVDFDTYVEQLRTASAAGASGYAVGRSLWGDLVGRQTFDRKKGHRRLQTLQAAAR